MKYKKIGEILVLDKYQNDVNELLTKHNVKTIIKVNKIHGQLRKPNMEILAGSNTETIHKENGCLFKLDLSKVMWSKGNINERLRIAKQVKDGEEVLDMFAGIGYFSIPIAKHSNPKQIIAIEINPDSFYYLKENISLNKLDDKIKPILGDSSILAKNYSLDRVIMGYIKTTHHFLKSAIDSLKEGGILHYHETTPDKLTHTRPLNRIKEIAPDKKIELLDTTVIKKYSPGVSHVVADFRIF
ncbi:MAG: class I SAM-dependent methyltransferase family protein [Methanobrevibacter sp.]|jgi:tRNA wybutosine-synthesizing protein 2|nr:class I SAM-dependent methyltransferase family protein [Methanobrevibacter sp.]